MDMPTWQVVALGFGTVFVVLVCIIFICKIMSAIIAKFVKIPSVAPVVSAPARTQVPAINTDKQQILVAISVAIAEQVGVDVSRIRIHSINKV